LGGDGEFFIDRIKATNIQFDLVSREIILSKEVRGKAIFYPAIKSVGRVCGVITGVI